jgi:hypothetical protein
MMGHPRTTAEIKIKNKIKSKVRNLFRYCQVVNTNTESCGSSHRKKTKAIKTKKYYVSGEV